MGIHALADAVLCPLQCLAGVEGLAILTSADFLLDIQRLALDNDIEPSPSCFGGWKVWAQAVRSLGQGTLPLGSSGVSLNSTGPDHNCFTALGRRNCCEASICLCDKGLKQCSYCLGAWLL